LPPCPAPRLRFITPKASGGAVHEARPDTARAPSATGYRFKINDNCRFRLAAIAAAFPRAQLPRNAAPSALANRAAFPVRARSLGPGKRHLEIKDAACLHPPRSECEWRVSVYIIAPLQFPFLFFFSFSFSLSSSLPGHRIRFAAADSILQWPAGAGRRHRPKYGRIILKSFCSALGEAARPTARYPQADTPGNHLVPGT